ncbi:zinc finger domain-containing protein [Streptomyces sp. 4N509B]|uniref:zinc finger domain-containing protein n=1 Tax=Streptomyces sp. 4N509B TaxID=3457413 RepID=UPI003FD2EDF9
MSSCAAPAGSPCRTGKGKVAVKYHTARFRLVPQLAKTLTSPPRPYARSLAKAGVTRVIAERISTRAVKRPELDKAVTLARELRASGVAVTLVVHEHKRLGRGIDLATLAEELKAFEVGRSSSPASCRAPTTLPGWCSPCSRRCQGWSASRSATAPWRATSPPVSAARPSAAPPSPTRTCSPWPCTTGIRG